MGWTEGVLVISLVIVRVYALGLEAIRGRIRASSADVEPRVNNQRWLLFLLLSSVGAAALLGTSALLAAAGSGQFSAGVRVGLALWLSEVLVHAGSLAGFVRTLRAGGPITPELALSQPVACWTSTVLSVPTGALLGSWIAR
jgi:hypothetical protein